MQDYKCHDDMLTIIISGIQDENYFLHYVALM